jgi:hypothetical protein
MEAREVKPGVWRAWVDRHREFEFKLTELGLQAQQVSTISDSKNVSHPPELLSFSDAIAKTEKQLTML